MKSVAEDKQETLVALGEAGEVALSILRHKKGNHISNIHWKHIHNRLSLENSHVEPSSYTTEVTEQSDHEWREDRGSCRDCD